MLSGGSKDENEKNIKSDRTSQWIEYLKKEVVLRVTLGLYFGGFSGCTKGSLEWDKVLNADS